MEYGKLRDWRGAFSFLGGIMADFLMKDEIKTRNVFTFLSQDSATWKYFCRSFFPQIDKDYSMGQTNWTLLYKKKIKKSIKQETVLYDRLKKQG
ncbi:MAG: hypothetical protein IJT42_10530 [Treponema sp.]|nr:hypothetical protein [Treponema sp.]